MLIYAIVNIINIAFLSPYMVHIVKVRFFNTEQIFLINPKSFIMENTCLTCKNITLYENENTKPSNTYHCVLTDLETNLEDTCNKYIEE